MSLSQASAYLSYGDQEAALVAAITDDQQALDSLRLLTTATRLRTDKLRRDTSIHWRRSRPDGRNSRSHVRGS